MEILLPRQQQIYKDAGLKRLGLKNLQEYREKPWWKEFKESYYQRHRNAYRCKDCGDRHGLEIDHESYQHLGCERDSEVAYRCDACHVAKHERWNAIAREEQKFPVRTAENIPNKKAPRWRSLLRFPFWLLWKLFIE